MSSEAAFSSDTGQISFPEESLEDLFGGGARPKATWIKDLLTCPVCDLAVRGNEHFRDHFSSAHPDTVQCPRCFKCLRKEWKPERHVCDPRLICHQCDPPRNLEKTSRFKVHQINVHGSPGHICGIQTQYGHCSKVLGSKRELKTHIKLAHQKVIARPVSPPKKELSAEAIRETAIAKHVLEEAKKVQKRQFDIEKYRKDADARILELWKAKVVKQQSSATSFEAAQKKAGDAIVLPTRRIIPGEVQAPPDLVMPIAEPKPRRKSRFDAIPEPTVGMPAPAAEPTRMRKGRFDAVPEPTVDMFEELPPSMEWPFHGESSYNPEEPLDEATPKPYKAVQMKTVEEVAVKMPKLETAGPAATHPQAGSPTMAWVWDGIPLDQKTVLLDVEQYFWDKEQSAERQPTVISDHIGNLGLMAADDSKIEVLLGAVDRATVPELEALCSELKYLVRYLVQEASSGSLICKLLTNPLTPSENRQELSAEICDCINAHDFVQVLNNEHFATVLETAFESMGDGEEAKGTVASVLLESMRMPVGEVAECAMRVGMKVIGWLLAQERFQTELDIGNPDSVVSLYEHPFGVVILDQVFGNCGGSF